VAAVQAIIAKHCQFDMTAPPKLPVDPDCATDINTGLLSAWQIASNDPDSAVCEWLLNGAPAGLSRIPENCGIFPMIGDIPEKQLHELETDYAAFENYAGVDDDDTATVEFERHLGLNRLKAFETLEESHFS
jgi:hypothetical protein